MPRSGCPLAAEPAGKAAPLERPAAAGGSTVLRAQVFALEIDEVDSAGQRFTANLLLIVVMSWIVSSSDPIEIASRLSVAVAGGRRPSPTASG